MKKILLSFLSILFLTNIHSQCEIIATTANTSFNCNDSVVINLEGYSQVFTTDTFSFNGPTSGAWTSTSGAEYGTPYIPSNQGGAYFWMGPSATVPTALTTTPFDFTGISGGQICFEFVYASGNVGQHADGSIPEQPDQYDEGIEVQFNTGTGWQSIVYYAPNGDTLPANPQTVSPGVVSPGPFEVWTEICLDIPAAAIGESSVEFQWLQDNNSGACCDHWGIDDVYIVASDNTYNAFLVNDGSAIGPTPASVIVTPTSDSSFVFLYTNFADLCYDTIDLFVNNTDAGPDVTVSCSTLGIPLSVEGVMPWSDVTWSPALGLSNTNVQNPYANPVDDQMYIVTSDCGVDSTFVNVVPIFTPTVSATADSICVGETTVLTVVSDQTTPTYTYEWSPATVTSDSTMSTTAFPTINTTYIVEMVSDSGCVRQDSVSIFVGAIPKTIEFIGDPRICLGDSTQIEVVPTPVTFFDDFELSANPSIWINVVNGTSNIDCGSFSGNSLHFDGAGVRSAELYPVDASLGGTFSFYLIYGSTFGISPCSDMGFNDVMTSQYSIDGGATWVDITTYGAFNYDNWTLIQEDIPVAAQTPSTIFRLYQPVNGGVDADNWAIDDFLLELNCTGTGCVQYTYLWSPAATVTNPNIADPFFFPEVSTWYSVAISPEGFNCNAAADSILVEVDEMDLSISPSDTFICEPNTPLVLEASVPSLCDYTLKMYDSFGDGWNGNNVDIIVDGASVGSYTLTSPATADSATVTFTAPNASTLELSYDGSGSFQNEVSFELYDHFGNLIFSDGPSPATGVSFSTVADCQGTLYWTENSAAFPDSITNPLVSPSVNTEYVIHVINDNNCLFTDTATVSIYESNTTLTADIAACFGDSIQLEATGADSYAWTSSTLNNNTLSDTSISNPLSGTINDVTYYVTYNTQGCEELDSVNVNILNLPIGTINNGINPAKFCEGTDRELFVDNLNGWSYTWEDASGNTIGTNNTVTVSEAGTYSIVYNDGTCDNETFVTVQENPSPIINFDTVEHVLCCTGYDEEVIFQNYVNNVTIGQVFINGDEITDPSKTYFSEDQDFTQLDHYRIVSTDGCEAEADLAIATRCMNASFTNPDTVYLNSQEVFDLTVNSPEADNITYSWTTTEAGNAIEDASAEDATFNGATEGGPYEANVQVTALYGTRTCTEDITPGSYQVVSLEDPQYPDAFSPNGDGTNDFFKPIVNSLATINELRIYNRWGDLVYDMANDPEKLGWDGKWNNKDQASDLYMYFTNVTHPDGKKYIQEGSLSLIR